MEPLSLCLIGYKIVVLGNHRNARNSMSNSELLSCLIESTRSES